MGTLPGFPLPGLRVESYLILSYQNMGTTAGGTAGGTAPLWDPDSLLYGKSALLNHSVALRLSHLFPRVKNTSYY